MKKKEKFLISASVAILFALFVYFKFPFKNIKVNDAPVSETETIENFVLDENAQFLQQALAQREASLNQRKEELLAELQAKHSSESNIYVIAGEQFELGTPIADEPKKPDENAIHLDDNPSEKKPVNYSTKNQTSGITMVLIPVDHKTIQNITEYNNFKNQYGNNGYPKNINFETHKLIYIPPSNGMPNNILQIVDKYEKNDILTIEYITSVAALAGDNLPPEYVLVKKSDAKINLLQVPYRETK